MIGKTLKWTAAGVVGAVVVGGVLFGTDAWSYITTGANQLQQRAENAVPIDFQLDRARDLLGEVTPELHEQIRQIATEEVEIAMLEKDIAQSQSRLSDAKRDLRRVRTAMGESNGDFTPTSRYSNRSELAETLAGRFERVQQAEQTLSHKQALLQRRQESLDAALQQLETVRVEKDRIEQQIAALEAQHRLQQAAGSGLDVEFNTGAIAKAKRVLGDIERRLKVNDRVLAHESRFEDILSDSPVIDETTLLDDVDAYLNGETAKVAAETH